MSELRMIYPLMDGMIVEKERIGHNGQPSYILRKEKDGERYVLNILSLPENDSRIRALILSGAYENEDAVHEYYGKLAEDIKQELNIGQQLATSGCFAGAVNYHLETKPGGVGYDLYILYPLNISLAEFLAMNAMTGLRALNLGIDLCEAALACRQNGYLHLNLRPESVFLMPSGRFLIGGLGLTSLEFLQYASVPEEYIGAFSAPEMSDITASPNLTVDIYAIGMILYLIYNGNHGPFEDESTNAAMADRLRLTGKPLPSPIYADYELAEIIMKACAFKQKDRFQSPEELKQALILYMQRNAISDDLIAPPIVANIDPVPLIDEEIDDEPIRMTEAEDLDDDFRQNFAPDLSTSGDDTYVAPEADDEPIAEEPVASEPEAEPAIEEPEVIDPDQIDLEDLLTAADNVLAEDKSYEELAAAPKLEESIPEAPAVEEQPAENAPKSKKNRKKGAKNQQAPAEPQPEPVAEEQPPAESDEAPAISAPQFIPAPAESEYTDDEDDYTPQHKKHKRSKPVTWTLVAVIVLGLLIGGYFLYNWYFVDIAKIETVLTTPTQIVVSLQTEDNPEHFSVTCADAYGNIYHGVRSGEQYSFMNLRENTSYTISVEPKDYHRFSSSVPALNETTNEYTVISDMKVERDESDCNVKLNFTAKGPEPKLWRVTYAQADGSDLQTIDYAEGDIIRSLELYKSYTFTLENVEGIFLSGETTTTFDVYPSIDVTEFAVKDIQGDTVTLAWQCGDVLPDVWNVHCARSDNRLNQNLEATGTSLDVHIDDFSKSYTFTLTALGMDEPMVLVLDANPIVVSNLKAAADGNGNLVVSWDAPAGKPESQWLITYKLVKDGYYNPADNHDIPSVSCSAEEDTLVTLKNLPANAQYEITITALNSGANAYPRVFGTAQIEASTSDVIPFDEYQVWPAAPYGDGYDASGQIALWVKPDMEEWDWRDLPADGRQNAFLTTDEIAMCIEVDSCDMSESVINDTVTVTYVVRKAAHGGVIMVDSREMQWSSVWFERRHTGIVPMPLMLKEDGTSSVQTGQFLIEIYINGKLLASKGFTIDA